MRQRLFLPHPIFFLFLVMSQGGSAAAGEYEAPPQLRAADAVPADRLTSDASTREGRAVVLAATDHVVWTEDLDGAARRFAGLAAVAGAPDVEAVFLGSLSPRARRPTPA
jgi:hypothetical protein